MKQYLHLNGIKMLFICLLVSGIVTPMTIAWGQRQEKGITAESSPSLPPTSQTYQLINSIFASGNTGTQMESTSFQMQGVVGEVALPANSVTTISSTNFQHQPGFLAAAPPPSALGVYLPVVLRPCEGFSETEPNDSSGSADGPLCSGRDHLGFPDQQDWFFFDISAPGAITVDLSGHTGTGVQLHLYYEETDEAHRVGYDSNSPYHIDCPDVEHPTCGAVGRYYVLLYAVEPYGNGIYTLRVNYP